MAYQSAQSFLRTEASYDSEHENVARNANYREFIKTLFQEHNRALIGFLTSRLRSESEAEDVAQEAYVRLLQLERPGTVSFIRSYLFRIAENLAVDRLRQRAMREKCAPEQTFLFEKLLSPPDTERTAIAQQQLDLVKAALKDLPEKCREVCVLHFFAGRSIKEIAAEMRLTERMIRYHVAHGLAYCRARLDGSDAAVPS